MSRVDSWRSITPTTRNSDDLKSAWPSRSETRERGVALPVAQHDGQHAELAHGAEREDALEVGFAQRLEAAEEHREDAEGDDDRPPRRRGERRGAARDEVDAAFTIAAACR
jgi:hypothetical protein